MKTIDLNNYLILSSWVGTLEELINYLVVCGFDDKNATIWLNSLKKEEVLKFECAHGQYMIIQRLFSNNDYYFLFYDIVDTSIWSVDKVVPWKIDVVSKDSFVDSLQLFKWYSDIYTLEKDLTMRLGFGKSIDFSLIPEDKYLQMDCGNNFYYLAKKWLKNDHGVYIVEYFYIYKGSLNDIKITNPLIIEKVNLINKVYINIPRK